jgi:hypothetical protein
MTCYYFAIPKKDVKHEHVNCSTAKSINELRIVTVKGFFFNTDYAILKVPSDVFERVNYFDAYQAHDLNSIKKFIGDNAGMEE